MFSILNCYLKALSRYYNKVKRYSDPNVGDLYLKITFYKSSNSIKIVFKNLTNIFLKSYNVYKHLNNYSNF